jgi:hypothetical protein
MESPFSEPEDPGKTTLELLEQLRQHSELLQAVQVSSPTGRVNQKKLRQKFPPELVRDAVALYETRQRAKERLPKADQLWLTRTGLEQATTWLVAKHKAKRFQGHKKVADLIRKADAGLITDNTADAIASAIGPVTADPRQVARFRQSARKLAEMLLDREKLAAKAVVWLESLAEVDHAESL